VRHHFCECLPGPLMDAIGRAVAGRPADTCERKASMPSDARSQGPTMASGARLAVLRTASLAAPTPVSGTRPLTARTCRTFPSGPPSTKASPGGGVDRRWPRSGLLFCHPTPDRKWYVISYYLGRQGDQSILSWDPPPVAAIRHLCGGEPGEDDTMYQTERIALGNGVTL